MIRRSAIFALFVAAGAIVVCAADLPQQWRSWRYSRSVESPSSQAAVHAEVSLPWDLIARCRPGCPDLRLIDDRGLEVPFELLADRGEFHSETHPAKIVENSFVRGEYTQLIADVGQEPPTYDRVSLETPKPDFIVWAELALSDDAGTWRVVEPRAPIARFRSRAVDGTQTIPFQGLCSRYVRLRIFESSEQFPVDVVNVLNQISRKAERTEIPSSFSAAPSSEEGETSWTADLSTGAYPISEVRFSTGTPEFYRAVRISGSNDGQEWVYLASGTIYRYSQGKTLRESLGIEFPESPGYRFSRVTIVNANDAPLSNLRIALFAAPRKLLFKQEPAEHYRIVYGHERASSPQYDLSRYLEFGTAKPVYVMLGLGPEELTSNYLDPRPFTERHPALLWVVLGIAVLLLGYAALHALRTPPQLKSRP